MPKRLEIEYVKKYFIKYGCTCLANEYIKNTTLMRYICSCGNESEITQASFKSGRRCNKCRIKPGQSLKLSYEYVKDYFESQNCKLLETEYVNSITKMRYICSCGNESEIRYSSFKFGKRCNKCGRIKAGQSNKFSHEFVADYFESKNCKLLDKYVNSSTKMRYICSCGNEMEACQNQFYRGERCKKCGYKKMAEAQKLSPEFVKDYFESQNCKLLDKYISSKIPMRYICSCGNESEIRYSAFKFGHRCNKCGYIKAAQSIRLSHEYVATYFESQNCTLLDKYTGAHKVMRYICSCGNESEVCQNQFYSGNQRCRKCSGIISKGERKVKSILDSFNIISISEYKFQNCKFKSLLRFDFYLPDYNICIEYDGQQHYNPVKFGGININKAIQCHINTLTNDEIKNKYCKDNGIKLIRIPYTEFDNIEQLLEKELDLKYEAVA